MKKVLIATSSRRQSRYPFPMWKRKAYITLLALITAFLGWYAFDGILTVHRADKLCDAIHAEDIELVRSLLEKGIDPTWENSFGKTSLYVAEQNPDLDILKLVREAAAQK